MSYTDTELLELAAKAAGIALLRCRLHDPACRDFLLVERASDDNAIGWNPLTDDGDAMRLAVRMGIALDRTSNRCWTFVAGMAIQGVCEEFYGDDSYAATRRAIVRAAAEIGKAMQENATARKEGP
jgi:hypothetical protein